MAQPKYASPLSRTCRTSRRSQLLNSTARNSKDGRRRQRYTLAFVSLIDHQGATTASKRRTSLLRDGLAKTSNKPTLNPGPSGSNSLVSIRIARHIATQKKLRRIVKNSPPTIETVCSATSASLPPAYRRAVAQAPSVKAQKTRCGIGGSESPLDASESITRDPLSELVTK